MIETLAAIIDTQSRLSKALVLAYGFLLLMSAGVMTLDLIKNRRSTSGTVLSVASILAGVTGSLICLLRMESFWVAIIASFIVLANLVPTLSNLNEEKMRKS